tara:strand:+ start:3953 stop:4183 length:231 start_codon:yes stop_codon:yes gene_type:complete
MRSFTITFSAQGWIKQHVVLCDDNVTAEEAQKGLNDGTMVTTIQEGGSLEITKDGKRVGVVEFVDNNLEYEDFEVE